MRTDPGLQNPDGFYEALIAANEGRTPEESLAFTLRLVLILANQIGDADLLQAAIAAAGDERPPPGEAAPA